MPSKRNRKSNVLAKSRKFREKKEQANIDHESDGSFSDDEFQPEPYRSSAVARDVDSDSEQLPKRNKFEVFPINVASSDEDEVGATRVRSSARGGNGDSKHVLRPSSYQRASAERHTGRAEEEQLAFDDDTDSDVDDNAPVISSSDYKKMRQTYDTLAEEQRRERHKAELASDLEIASNDEEVAPAADQRRTTATTDAATAEDDEELDEMALEESEALAAQRRLAALVDEGDLALAAPTETNEEGRQRLQLTADMHKISSEHSGLTKADQIRLLKRDSPELLGLARELRRTLRALERRWRPLHQLLADARVGAVARKALTPLALSLADTAFRLHSVYAINITAYFLMKLRQKSVTDHPVISHIWQYRSLLDKLAPLIEQYGKHFDRLLKQLPVIASKYEALSLEERKAMDEAIPAAIDGESEEQASEAESVSAEEYAGDGDGDDDGESEAGAEEDRADNGDGGGGGGRKRVERLEKTSSTQAAAVDAGNKRKINYLMEKNPGLKPRRPKKQRNPRVKHRLAYKRALLRNRTRDRAHSRPQQEPTRYTGERFGMRAGLVRSRKLV